MQGHLHPSRMPLHSLASAQEDMNRKWESRCLFQSTRESKGVTEGCFHRSSILETHCFSTFSIFCLNIYRCVSPGFSQLLINPDFSQRFPLLASLESLWEDFFSFLFFFFLNTPEGWQSQKNCKTSHLLRIPRLGGSWLIGQDFGNSLFP